MKTTHHQLGRNIPSILARAVMSLLFVLSAGPAGWCAQSHVGVVVEVSGASKITHEGKETTLEKGNKLYKGDIIVKEKTVQAPKVMWWPYASWKDPEAERLEVVCNPPQAREKKGLMDKLSGFMGFAETEYASVDGVADQHQEIDRDINNQTKDVDESFSKAAPTAPSAEKSLSTLESDDMGSRKDSIESPPHRDQKAGPQLPSPLPSPSPSPAPSPRPRPSPGATGPFEGPGFPLPGHFATVVTREPIRFSWNEEAGKAKAIVFRDSRGHEVFRKEVYGPIELKAEEIGLKPDETYVWSLEGLNSPIFPKIRMLAKDNLSQINADMKGIDASAGPLHEKRLKKIAFLQFVSDSFPGEIDLYWLSNRYIEKMEAETPDPGLKAKLARYKARVHEHLRKADPDRVSE